MSANAFAMSPEFKQLLLAYASGDSPHRVGLTVGRRLVRLVTVICSLRQQGCAARRHQRRARSCLARESCGRSDGEATADGGDAPGGLPRPRHDELYRIVETSRGDVLAVPR